MAPTRRYTLTISCPDRSGIIAAVSGFIAKHNGWIVEASYHTDLETQRFFMRQEILAGSLPFDLDEFHALFSGLAGEFNMDSRVSDSARKKRVVILVSKQDHCLNDLLHRWRSGELQVDIPCVISNHEDLRSFVEWHGIPFHHVAMPGNNEPAKAAAFEEIARLSSSFRAIRLCWRVSCRSCRRICASVIWGGLSISTTASCPHSSGRSPITRPINAA